MKEIELDDGAWCRLKRSLMTNSADEALSAYEPPVKLTHGCEYIIYEKGGAADNERSNE